MKTTYKENTTKIIREFLDLIEERGIDDIEELGDIVEREDFYFLGNGAECSAYFYKGICIKDYCSISDAIRQCKKWKSVIDTPLFPEFYGANGQYLFMELIDGIEYAYYKGKAVDNVDIQNTLKKFAYDHLQKNIITQDLHSHNIMIDKNHNIKIIDVGYFKQETLDKDSREEYYNDLCQGLNEDYPIN